MNKRFGKDAKIIWQDTKRWCGLPITFTKYYLVEHPGRWIKLYHERGMLHTHLEEVHMYRINDLTMYSSVINKTFGVGNIDVYYDDSGPDSSFTISRVKNIYKAYDLLTEYIEKDRTQRGVKSTEFRR